MSWPPDVGELALHGLVILAAGLALAAFGSAVGAWLRWSRRRSGL